MLKLLSRIASQIFIYGVSIDFCQKDKACGVQFRLKDLSIKDDESNAIILEDLSVAIENLADVKNGSPGLEDASFIVESLGIMVSQEWINKLLKNNKKLEKRGIHNLRVDLTPRKLSILGDYKKFITIPFSIDIKFSVFNGKIQIEFDRFWAADLIPLPRWVQKALLNILKEYIKYSKSKIIGIKISGQFVLIDHLALLPFDCYFDINKIFINDHFLVIKGSADREESLRLIAEKKKKKREEEILTREMDMRKKEEDLRRELEKQEEGEKMKIPYGDLDDVKDKEERIEQLILNGGETSNFPNKPHAPGSQVEIKIDGEPLEEDEETHKTIEFQHN